MRVRFPQKSDVIVASRELRISETKQILGRKEFKTMTIRPGMVFLIVSVLRGHDPHGLVILKVPETDRRTLFGPKSKQENLKVTPEDINNGGFEYMIEGQMPDHVKALIPSGAPNKRWNDLLE